MNEPYITLAGMSDAELTEKKSRFLSFAAPVGSEAEAIAFISEIRSAYPDARHCVYAYRITSAPPYTARYSDDGEPQGTGGLPVLDVLKKRGIGDAAIAVVRYFGGILLGAPGLVRAYSSSASLAVRAAGLVRMTPLAPVTVSVSYPLWGRLEASAPRFSVSSGQPEYAEQVKCTFYVYPENTESAISAIADICSGKAECSLGDIRYFAVPVEESGD